MLTELSPVLWSDIGRIIVKEMDEGNVNYYHHRDQLELAKFYANELSALVVPSFFETYCNCAIESIVCGTPVLLSDAAGAKEVLIKYGIDNFIFSLKDTDSFRKALDLAKDSNFIINEDIRREIYNDLSWKNVIGKYNQIINKVAETSR